MHANGAAWGGRRSAADLGLDSVEDPHQQARSGNSLGSLGHIVVVHVSVSRRVSQYGVRPSEQRPSTLSLTGIRLRIGERAAVAERLIHQGDADEVVSQNHLRSRTRTSTAFIDTNTACSYSPKRKLPACSPFDVGVQSLVQAVDGADVSQPALEGIVPGPRSRISSA